MTPVAPRPSSRPRPAFWLLLGLVPPACALSFIATYSVNARYWDDWWLSPVLTKFAAHTLTLADLTAQYNESRSLFPRLAMIACAVLTHGDARAQIYFTFALAAFASVALYFLCRPLIPDRSRRLQFWFLANVCIFSPVQHQTWIWAVQIVVLFPLFWLLLAALVIPRTRSRYTRLLLAILIATAATYSHANGLLLWLLVVPLSFPVIARPTPARTPVSQRGEDPDAPPSLTSDLRPLTSSTTPDIRHLPPRAYLLPTAIYLLAAALVLLAYFHHYTHPAQNPGLRPALAHPVDTARFFLTLLGVPFAWGLPVKSLELPLATAVGAIELLLAVTATAAILRRARHDRALLPRTLPFLLLLAYTLLTAALTAAGRSGFGPAAALTNRYTTYNLYLPVALLYLLPQAFPRFRPRPYLVAAAVLVILPTLTLLPANLAVARAFRTHHLQGKAALHYAVVIPGTPVPGQKLLPDNPDLRSYADALDRADFFRPRLARTDDVTPASTASQSGALESLANAPGALTATGYAILPDRHEPADAVVLAWRDPAGHDHALAVTADFTPRPDVAAALNDPRYLASGWRITIDPARVPKDSRALVAYAADATTAATHPLANPVPIAPPAP